MRVLQFIAADQPTAEWPAQQIVQAFGWGTAPQYLMRDCGLV